MCPLSPLNPSLEATITKIIISDNVQALQDLIDEECNRPYRMGRSLDLLGNETLASIMIKGMEHKAVQCLHLCWTELFALHSADRAFTVFRLIFNDVFSKFSRSSKSLPEDQAIQQMEVLLAALPDRSTHSLIYKKLVYEISLESPHLLFHPRFEQQHARGNWYMWRDLYVAGQQRPQERQEIFEQLMHSVSAQEVCEFLQHIKELDPVIKDTGEVENFSHPPSEVMALLRHRSTDFWQDVTQHLERAQLVPLMSLLCPWYEDLLLHQDLSQRLPDPHRPSAKPRLL